MTLDARRTTDQVVSVRSITELCDAILPALPEAWLALAARAQRILELPSLGLEVGDDACTLDGTDGVMRATGGVAADALRLRLDPDALDDLVAERRTTLGLAVGGDVSVPPAAIDAVACWDYVLRALLYGQAVHENGTVTFTDRDRDRLDLNRSFSPADDDRDIAHFLEQAGFLHLRGWVEPSLMPPVVDDIIRAARDSKPDDPGRWWAKLETGERRCVRVQHFLDESAAMREIVGGDAYERVRGLSCDGHELRLDSPAAVEALLKPLGVVEGLADFPWHRDCSTGGHPYQCSAMAVGLAVTAADVDSGQLGVLAGSHRSAVPSTRAGRRTVDLPTVRIETRPGDLTVHLSCTLHTTRPPRTRERSVVYTTFQLPHRPGEDHQSRRDPAYEKAASTGRAPA
ncbi:MAG: phytanoyl-CoA dioxygenase family protein [Acidimicrobiales bacterium]